MADKEFRLLFFCILFILSNGSERQNLLKNPDFEDPFGNNNWSCSGSCTIERSDDSYSGNYSGKIAGR